MTEEKEPRRRRDGGEDAEADQATGDGMFLLDRRTSRRARDPRNAAGHAGAWGRLIPPSLNGHGHAFTPHPMSTYMESVPRGDGAANTSTVVHHVHPGPFTSLLGTFADKARGAGWPVREIASGHDVMLIDPEGVAHLLLELAAG